MKINKTHFVVGIIIIAILSRLIPHPPNFTPVTAVALFSIINFKNKYIAVSIPIICLFVSDLILGISLINLFVYFSFILIIGIGYPKTLEGLITCYIAAIPFFGYTLVGDLFYSYSAKISLNFFERKFFFIPSN